MQSSFNVRIVRDFFYWHCILYLPRNYNHSSSEEIFGIPIFFEFKDQNISCYNKLVTYQEVIVVEF